MQTLDTVRLPAVRKSADCRLASEPTFLPRRFWLPNRLRTVVRRIDKVFTSVDIGEDPQASNWSDFVPLKKSSAVFGGTACVSSNAGGTPLMSKFIAAG